MMKVTQLYIYPIKSLRGISLPSATLCAQGLEYDRRYILLKPSADGTWTNMFVGMQPEMALFHCTLSSPTTFSVYYQTPSPPISAATTTQKTKLEVPLEPDHTKLERIQISIHNCPTYPAYRMPNNINAWFSECFGYEAVLAYMGNGLGVKMEDERTKSWVSSMKPILPNQTEDLQFSDGAALLIASEASVSDLHPRLEDGKKVILEKFRPNIVVAGAAEPWDEDFWAELTLTRIGARIILTSNCARCTSINVDLERGIMGEGESGKLLKKMMRDRRIDAGSKWSPIFGRYGFPTKAGDVKVDDEVAVSLRNNAHTVWNGVMPRLTKVDQAMT